MSTTEQKRLARRAKKAGVHTFLQPCSRCKGEGFFLVPDPLDLQLLRERTGASIYAFAKAVLRPDGKTGVSSGFIKMVENPDPKRGRKCPEWLLAQYLEAPGKSWTPPKKGDPFKHLRGMTLREQKQALAERREKRRLEREKDGPPVRKGQIYEREGSEPPLRFEVTGLLEGTTAIVKRMDLEAPAPRAVTVGTLKNRKKYRYVGEAA